MSERPIVFRIQDRKGCGPFKPGVSKKWCDDDFGPGVKNHPTMMEEFGHDLIDRKGLPGEHYGTAVRDVEKLAEWFSASEREKLRKLGYRVVSMKIDRILAESPNQLIFARHKPLYRDVRIEKGPASDS